MRAAPGVITEGGDEMAKICVFMVETGKHTYFCHFVTSLRNAAELDTSRCVVEHPLHRVPPDLATLLRHWKQIHLRYFRSQFLRDWKLSGAFSMATAEVLQNAWTSDFTPSKKGCTNSQESYLYTGFCA